MTKKTKAEQARHQRDDVYVRWTSRPAEQRKTADLDGFMDGLWAEGICLGRTNTLHQQHVMDIIRQKVER